MADFKIAVDLTLVNEGGYVNDLNDAGGETNFGITKREFPNEDIKNMTQQRAEEIYQEKYWNPLYAEIQSQDFCNKIFDLGVLFGVGTAVMVCQVLLEVAADGSFGPMTLKAVNEADANSLLQAFKTSFVNHAVNIGAARPQDREFVAGWIRRINK